MRRPVKIEDRENELVIFAVLNRGNCLNFRLGYLFFAAFLVPFFAAAFFFGFFFSPLIAIAFLLLGLLSSKLWNIGVSQTC